MSEGRSITVKISLDEIEGKITKEDMTMYMVGFLMGPDRLVDGEQEKFVSALRNLSKLGLIVMKAYYDAGNEGTPTTN